MTDMATISAILGSIKTATEIVKFLRESDQSIEKAELKLKLAELLSSLADAKVELIEVQELLAEKDRKIAELIVAFETKDELVQHYDAYYNKGKNGEAIGKPYCLRCWESDRKQRQLVCSSKDFRTMVCTSCGQQYNGRTAFEIQPQA
jgi:hypothetical protein